MLTDGIGNLPHFTSGGSVHLVVEWVSVLVLSLVRFLMFFLQQQVLLPPASLANQ